MSEELTAAIDRKRRLKAGEPIAAGKDHTEALRRLKDVERRFYNTTYSTDR